MASRGLDIKDFNLVINYDFPRNIEEYVHRVGRTGKQSEAITFFSNRDKKHAAALIDVLDETDFPIPSKLYTMVV